MSTTSVGNTTSTTTGAGAAAGGAVSQAANAIPSNLQISESGFLQLITTQMQAQNPLQPSDPTQFLTQLEGMSEVSSMQNVQTSIDALTSTMQSSQMLSGASLLGHSVLAPGTTGTLTSGGTLVGAVTPPTGTSNLTVSITDASGALVNSFSVTPASSGLTYFGWNGSTSSGTTAAAGQYNVAVTANVGGSSQSVSPLVVSPVESVTLDSSTNALDVNTPNGTIPLSSVVSVM